MNIKKIFKPRWRVVLILGIFGGLGVLSLLISTIGYVDCYPYGTCPSSWLEIVSPFIILYLLISLIIYLIDKFRNKKLE